MIFVLDNAVLGTKEAVATSFHFGVLAMLFIFAGAVLWLRARAAGEVYERDCRNLETAGPNVRAPHARDET